MALSKVQLPYTCRFCLKPVDACKKCHTYIEATTPVAKETPDESQSDSQ